MLTKNHLSLGSNCELFVRLFTNQSSDYLISYKTCLGELNSSRCKAIVTMLSILVLSSLVFMQQFSNLLLDIYFIINTEPNVDSIDEVCDNQDIEIRTQVSTIKNFKGYNPCNLDEENWARFKTRTKLYQSWYSFFPDEQNLLDLITGKTVILASSIEVQTLSQLPELNDQIYLPENKYYSFIQGFVVGKGHKFSRTANYLYVS